MNTPISWIKAYVPELECTDSEYADAMTLSGTKVENYARLDKDLDKIVVGRIEKIEKHPDADKLVVCQVDVGGEVIQIVTGAPNVEEGQLVPVVLDGGRVAGGHDGKKTSGGIKIKKGKLRGIVSNGMMCSIEELGSDSNFYPEAPKDGIYVFEGGVKPGDDAVDALGLRETVYEYEITSNRVDCYGVLGIAREAAATFKKPFVKPKEYPVGDEDDAAKYINVEVKDPDLCRRYCARVVKNVKIAPSPKWMQRRLSACGIRPINNLVDITNYVMEEYGQPMHAYDLATVAGGRIVVRRAGDNEKFTTLDGIEREMDSDVVMICDGEKAIGIGGIMGGENSMITDDVKDVLFEAACFDGTNIRLSTKRIGLRTDASAKFEKGLDPNNAAAAINRACELIAELGAGEVVPGMVDVYPEKNVEKTIPFDPEYVNGLLGTDISCEQMLSYFKPLELTYDAEKKEITIPTFRQDLNCPADIAEEVARFYGYDNIPTTLPTGEATAGKLPYEMRIQAIIEDVAEFSGFSQGMCYSFESPKVFDKLLLSEDSKWRDAVTIRNPLGEDFSIMRTMSVNGMLTSLATNYSRRNKDARLYEIANVYIPKELPLKELPDERMQLTLGSYGADDFFSMKGVVERIFRKIGMNDKVKYDPESGKEYLHPGRQANIIYGNRVVGFLGEVHPQVLKNYDIGQRAYIAVIDLPSIYDVSTFERRFKGLAKYPSVTRDFSLVVPKDILVGDIETAIEKSCGKLLESCTLFDVYEGSQIKAGFKSVAYSVVLRASDRTLEENDVAAVTDKIIKSLCAMGIELRG